MPERLASGTHMYLLEDDLEHVLPPTPSRHDFFMCSYPTADHLQQRWIQLIKFVLTPPPLHTFQSAQERKAVCEH